MKPVQALRGVVEGSGRVMQVERRADGRDRAQPRIRLLDGCSQGNMAADRIAEQQDVLVMCNRRGGERGP